MNKEQLFKQAREYLKLDDLIGEYIENQYPDFKWYSHLDIFPCNDGDFEVVAEDRNGYYVLRFKLSEMAKDD